MRQTKGLKIDQNGNGATGSAGSSVIHSFEPRDPIEVDTPHGLGFVIYITVQGAHGNDMWCVANQGDGKLRHYGTTQLKLAFNGFLGLNQPSDKSGCK